MIHDNLSFEIMVNTTEPSSSWVKCTWWFSVSFIRVAFIVTCVLEVPLDNSRLKLEYRALHESWHSGLYRGQRCSLSVSFVEIDWSRVVVSADGKLISEM